ncbi:serine/threonine protein phosphatase [Meiothermus sp. QL-1]|uniref:metallophosphoesterase n=1 Tax=Meiothermus sp. QL-1 TaxID=2058095 RepID=UPI000E0AFBF0|nr:metallophosphoesterase [Meiothermus sp. QL-1]RDI95361.1 serine/threonine protein phosphatase [Meiothermus sp. QL-1]
MPYVVGDVHGCLEALLRLLHQAGLVGPGGQWIGGAAELWFLGDYTDRGPDGVGVLELLMRLEEEAQQVGGAVHALLGNHDLILLAAYRFSQEKVPSLLEAGEQVNFLELWRHVGGQPHDLERLEERHVRWLEARPALARVGETLLMHADSTFYLELGERLEEVNQNLQALLRSTQVEAWDALIGLFSTRFAFVRGGVPLTKEFLRLLSAERLVHGHTPIYTLLGCPPQAVREPLTYNQGLCHNVDPALWKGGPGFVWSLPANT